MLNMMIQRNIPLRQYTTFKIGGPAQYFTKAETLADLRQAYSFARQHALPIFILGGGSNLLVADQGVRGLVIRLANTGLKFFQDKVRVGAGVKLDFLIKATIQRKLRGLENLSGIPGTVGGAVYGNAGAWGKCLADAVSRVWFFADDKLRIYEKAECEFAYRDSIFKRQPGVIWEVELDLKKGNPLPLENLRSAILAYRAKRYPTRDRSAGSFFKNVSSEVFPAAVLKTLPKYAFSGKEVASGYLIEAVGLLGKTYQGAQIAPHQGNYMVNFKGADSRAVIELAKRVRQRVWQKFKVQLEPEVQLLGFTVDPFKQLRNKAS